MTIEEEDLDRRVAIHAALADHHRLQIVDELAVSDRSPSDLAGSLSIPSNLLAHHLDVLAGAGLVERVHSAGDGRRRYVRLAPGASSGSAGKALTFAARHVLFVCTANTARSQMAAAVWNDRHDVPASSAGTRPAEGVREEAVEAAARVGLDLSGARSRSVADVTEHPDLVVTVCDVAHEELHTMSPGARVLHWSIPDPAGQPPAAYDDALAQIISRVETLGPCVFARPEPSRRSRR